MNKLLSLLMRPFLFSLLLCGVLVLSFSSSLRLLREEVSVTRRLQNSLVRLNRMQAQMSNPAQGLLLLKDSGVSTPFTEIPSGFREILETLPDPLRTHVGSGLDRVTIQTTFQNLPADRLGEMLSLFENGTSGWWITSLEVEATMDGLSGQLTVEALDNSPGEE